MYEFSVTLKIYSKVCVCVGVWVCVCVLIGKHIDYVC